MSCALLTGALASATYVRWFAPEPISSENAASIAKESEPVVNLAANRPAGGRPEYRYSVIPGGAYSPQELADAIERDPVVADHYRAVNVHAVRVETLTAPRTVYVSYRRNDRIYWTSRPLQLDAGETVLTDGVTTIRARCGNCISQTAMAPAATDEPAAVELDRIETSERPLAGRNPALPIDDIAAPAGAYVPGVGPGGIPRGFASPGAHAGPGGGHAGGMAGGGGAGGGIGGGAGSPAAHAIKRSDDEEANSPGNGRAARSSSGGAAETGGAGPTTPSTPTIDHTPDGSTAGPSPTEGKWPGTSDTGPNGGGFLAGPGHSGTGEGGPGGGGNGPGDVSGGIGDLPGNPGDFGGSGGNPGGTGDTEGGPDPGTGPGGGGEGDIPAVGSEDPKPIPEPATLLLIGAGVSLTALRRRSTRSSRRN